MRLKKLFHWILVLFLLPGQKAFAADPASLDALKSEFKDLLQRYEIQGAQLRSLAAKIQQLEAAQQQEAAEAAAATAVP